MKRKYHAKLGSFSLRLVLCWVAACSIVTGTLLAFFHSEAPTNVTQRTLTFAERVNYQRAIEEVYWRHRIWPRSRGERPDPKPSLDAVMSQAQLEKKVTEYLRKSQALEDYWQRPITSDQLQAEINRMAAGTKQPDVLRELFEALGNDPFVIAECFARQALADRLLRNWYASDQRIHGELKRRADADLQTCRTAEQMKRTSGTYSEVEFVRNESPHEEAVPGAGHGVTLNSDEWDNTLEKLGSLFPDPAIAAGIPPEPEHGKKEPASRGLTAAQIKTGVLSALQEDETRYYATAVIDKTDKGLRLATVSWVKDPLQSWLSQMENQLPSISTTIDKAYSLPKISDGAGCIDDTWTPTVGPPDARYAHTAIWTGSEMIVWGGLNGVAFNTGYKYDPTIDSWTATSTVGAPSGRGYHTALWTGSDMIVWGGSPDGSSQFNTGGRYDPNTDSWTATTTINAPVSRYDHSAVWTGTEMIVWGGYNGGKLNTGGKYNPSTDSWVATTTTNAPEVRASHTAVWTGSEMVVWGGYDFNIASELQSGGRYNPTTDSWTPTSLVNAPTARDYHTAVWTGSEMIIWGGHSNELGEFNTGGRYNPNTDSWTATTTVNAPSARNSHTAIWTGSEMIIWGAAADTSGGRYNPATDSWMSTSTINAPAFRFYHTAVWTGSEMIIWEGATFIINGSSYWNTGAIYNPVTDTWTDTSTTNAPSPRAGHTAVWTGTEMIIWGSGDNTGGRYNPNTDSWIATTMVNAPTGRSAHTAVWTGSEMIIWGGDDSSGFANTGGRYNPNTDSWTATSISNAPTGRDSHSAVWTGTEMIIWGGYSFDFMGHNLTTGGRYNPTTDLWLTTSTTNTPDGRSSHTAVWTGTEMVVWGGISFDPFHNPQYLNTGGRYNASTDSWTATSMSNAPGSRRSYTAVWTGDEMIIWGGWSLNTGARYSPVFDSWRATNTAIAPLGRESHTAVWTGTEMIIWGGERDPGGDLNVGARYCAVFTTPSPTPTATSTPTATATTTPTPTSTVTPRVTPTPRTRPSPRDRPTPPSHITPVPPPSSPRPTPAPRP